jgi:hypothetical protein
VRNIDKSVETIKTQAHDITDKARNVLIKNAENLPRIFKNDKLGTTTKVTRPQNAATLDASDAPKPIAKTKVNMKINIEKRTKIFSPTDRNATAMQRN